MVLLSKSEVAEAPTSANGKLLKVQECTRPGRTHAEEIREKRPCRPVLPLRNKGGGTEGSCWPASLLPGGLRTIAGVMSVCLSGREHHRLCWRRPDHIGETSVVCHIKHTWGLLPLKRFFKESYRNINKAWNLGMIDFNNKSWQWLSCTDHPSFEDLQTAEGALCRTLMEILVQKFFGSLTVHTEIC